ncbi:hypothetical protein [Paenibacillus sp. FSL R7-0128]|uniref:hypothetical protein n=1 Tax=Paenibacillus sp. FSL R7-0128 TaxID=2954529 RepID=UPI0030F9C436
MTQTPSRDWQKDMEMCEAVKDSKWLTLESSATAVWQRGGLMSTIWEGIDAEALQEHKTALPYWLQEAKERGRRERILKESLEHCIKEYPLYDSKEIGGSLMMDFMKNTLSILYPDTPAPKEGL